MKKNAVDIQIRRGVKLPFKKPFLRMIIEEALRTEKIDYACEISMLITSDKEIKELNAKYRGKDKPTDVLSFSLAETVIENEEYAFDKFSEERKSLGEIIVSYERVIEQARDYDKTTKDEIILLIVHGVLHLLGYDHESEKTARLMRKKEKMIIGNIIVKSL